MIVLLQRGAASRGIGEDGVELSGAKGENVLARQLAGRCAHAGMRGQRAAAELPARDNNFAAVGYEDANGSFIQLCERDIRDATGEESHTRAAGALRGKGLAEFVEKEMLIDVRQQALAIGEGEQFQKAGAASERLQAGALIETKQTGNERDAARVGKQVLENNVARESREKWAPEFGFNTRASVFNKFAVFHAGGAGRFTSAAIEAFVDVVDETA